MSAHRLTSLIAGTVGAAVLTFAAVDNIHAREVYRWVDNEGVVHLSDTPPLSARAETLIVPVVTPTASPAQIVPAARALPARAPNEAPLNPASASRVVQQVEVLAPSPPVAPPLTARRDGWFFTPLLGNPAPRASNPALGQAQRQALEQRGLSGARRPVSINSSAHAQRVARSQRLPLGEP
ncbi:MAG: DUF4124 domain-containing protein [Pseudomonadota bacterium]